MPPPEVLDAALASLGEVLASHGEVVRIVVVGGVAVNMRRLPSRATVDVDVIARAEIERGVPVLIRPEPLPGVLVDGIARVAKDFGLPGDWMNTAVAEQWRYGLPPTMADGIEWHVYGALHVGIAGRQALIALKLFAAVDQGPRSVHMQDLLRFRAVDDELGEAAAWVRQQDASAQFAADLEETLAYVRTHGR